MDIKRKSNQFVSFENLEGSKCDYGCNRIAKYLTITNKKGWKDGTVYDEPISGAKQFIDQLKNDAFEVIIFTARLSEIAHGKEGVKKQKQMIEDWLKKYGIEVDGITAEKIPATAYIDDLAIEFDGVWNSELLDRIKSRVDG